MISISVKAKWHYTNWVMHINLGFELSLILRQLLNFLIVSSWCSYFIVSKTANSFYVNLEMLPYMKMGPTAIWNHCNMKIDILFKGTYLLNVSCHKIQKLLGSGQIWRIKKIDLNSFNIDWNYQNVSKL